MDRRLLNRAARRLVWCLYERMPNKEAASVACSLAARDETCPVTYLVQISASLERKNMERIGEFT